MSRTDHHRPWQIRADDPNQRHPRAYIHHSWWDHRQQDGCGPGCGWTLPHTVIASGPDREYRRAVWWGPQRRREREQLTAMAREYSTYRELADGDFRSDQHRHQAAWMWF